MLAEAIEEWAAEAHAKGLSEGGIEVLRHIAVRRFGVAFDDGFGQLLAGEDDFDRLMQVTDLLFECANAEELLGRAHRLLKDGNGVR